MPVRPSSPAQQADIEQLTREIHEAVDAEIGELAANLLSTDDAHLFGENEFKIRGPRSCKIAAKASRTPPGSVKNRRMAKVAETAR